MVRGRAFSIIIAVSGLLCIATLGMWARSYYKFDRLSYRSGMSRLSFLSVKGTSALQYESNLGVRLFPTWNGGFRRMGPPPGWHHAQISPTQVTSVQSGYVDSMPSEYVEWYESDPNFVIRYFVILGFAFRSNSGSFALSVPHGLLALIFLLIALSPWIWNRLRQNLRLSSDARRRVRKTRRWFLISLVTVAVMLPITVLVAGFNFHEAWAAVWGTPLIYVLFITIPIVGAVMVISALRLQRSRLRARQVRHLCPACGYNLTGNESGSCSECGESILRKTDVPIVQTSRAESETGWTNQLSR